MLLTLQKKHDSLEPGQELENTANGREDKSNNTKREWVQHVRSFVFLRTGTVAMRRADPVRGAPSSTKRSAVSAHVASKRRAERFDLEKGLRDRNSPTCTLSQNGYGDPCYSGGVASSVTWRVCVSEWLGG